MHTEEPELWNVFHENSALTAWDWEIFARINAVNADPTWVSLGDSPIFDSQAFVEHVDLPAPRPVSVSLDVAIRNRRSTEDFRHGELPQESLSTVLHAACGVWGRAADSGRHLRSAPSPGGLNTVAAVVEVARVPGLSPGVYGFDPLRHALVPMGPACSDQQAFAMPCTGDPACVVWLVAALDRACSKYGDRGYRFVLLEAGHVAQNLLLVASALGIPARPIGGFLDHEALDRLHLAPFPVAPLYAIPLGSAAS